jgi:hypothetical protein
MADPRVVSRPRIAHATCAGCGYRGWSVKPTPCLDRLTGSPVTVFLCKTCLAASPGRVWRLRWTPVEGGGEDG